MFKGKLPYQLILDCNDVNDLYKKVMDNFMIHSYNDGLIFPLYEVVAQIIREDDDEFVIELANVIAGRRTSSIEKRIRRVLEEYIAEYLCETIHYEARLKSQDAVDELYHAYEPA